MLYHIDTQPKTVSEKENKKLSSRQDILEGVRLEKWALFNWWKVSKIKQMPFSLMLEFEEPNGVFKYRETNIYEILYSPESNFFEVMFNRLQTDICFYNWITKEEIMPFRGTDDVAKMKCLTSPDPLTFLLTELNETLGF